MDHYTGASSPGTPNPSPSDPGPGDPGRPGQSPTVEKVKAQASSFFRAMFDLSFREFITPRIIQVVFVVMLVLAGIGVLGTIVAAFEGGALSGVVTLILSPVIFLIAALFIRIYLEVVILLFRIYEVLRDKP
jgi:hypothetical protein